MKKLKILEKSFLAIFVLASTCFTFGILFMDKHYFLSPIAYEHDRVIRFDGRGDGMFGAERSGNRLHKGIDLLAKIGTPVLASASGKVVAATRNHGMGNYVIITHARDLVTLYGHLQHIYVRKGQYVRQGEVVGSVGKTGNANYRDMLPHLHFEVRKG
ncbi:MAG: M23 family metallopeptidase, partial [Candidatus Omnitrophota bacterium]